MTRRLERLAAVFGLAVLIAAGCNGRKLHQADGGAAGGGGESPSRGMGGGSGGSAAGGNGGGGETDGAAAGTGGGEAGGAAAGTGGSPGGGSGGSAAGGASGGGAGAPCPAVGSMVMVRVPAGFCIDTTEVTRGQYTAWLAGAPSTANQPASCASNTSFEPGVVCLLSEYVCAGVACDNHPQVCVDWCDARAYCAGVGKRLCGRIGGGTLGASAAALSASTSEWVNACTAGGTSDWPYGSTAVADRCNTTIDRFNGTVPVGSLSGCASSAPAFAGIFDMVGNVWEMQDACDDAGTTCVYRGGSFADMTSTQSGSDRGCASVYAYASPLGDSAADLGFRCCAD